MTTCIVIYLKTIFVNTYTYLKQCMCCFIMYKSLMNWKCLNILFISVTVRYEYVKYSVPVGHITISPYCWHSNQANYSRSKLVHGRIMRRRLSWKHYIYFPLINFTQEKISHAPWIFFFYYYITILQLVCYFSPEK